MLRGKLLKEREKRIRPGLDDKVLADWNGMMIAALASGGALLGEAGWIAMAARAFSFIAATMTRGDRLGTPGATAACCSRASPPTSPA